MKEMEYRLRYRACSLDDYGNLIRRSRVRVVTLIDQRSGASSGRPDAYGVWLLGVKIGP